MAHWINTGLLGYGTERLAGPGFKSMSGWSARISCMYAMGLISRTGIEGLPVSTLICDGLLCPFTQFYKIDWGRLGIVQLWRDNPVLKSTVCMSLTVAITWAVSMAGWLFSWLNGQSQHVHSFLRPRGHCMSVLGQGNTLPMGGWLPGHGDLCSNDTSRKYESPPLNGVGHPGSHRAYTW